MKLRSPFASVTLAFILAGAQMLAAASPRQLYRSARKAEKAGKYTEAFLLYSQAAAASPGNRKFANSAEALRERAAQQSPPVVAAAPGDSATVVNPEEVFDSLTAREFAAARQARTPVELQGQPGTQPVHLFLAPKPLYEAVARMYGLEVVFDSDFPTTAPVHLNLEQADFREALHAAEAVSSTFVVPIGPKLMLVAADTPAKRNDLEQTATAAVPLPNLLQSQEMVEIAQVIRQTVGVEKISWDSQANMIVLRDRVSRVRAAEVILSDLLRYRTQMVADVEFLEVDESDLMNIGIDWNAVLPVTYLGSFLRSAPTISSTAGLLTFGGGKTMFGIGVLNPSIYATLNNSALRQLLRTQIRSSDNQPATLHVGDKYPVLTGGYSNNAAVGVAGSSSVPAPSYTFEDLGITVKITPHIHGMSEMTLDLDTDFEVLTGTALNGIPIISNRKLTSTVRLKNGEYALVAGLINEGVSKTWTSVWGLGNLPVIGPLFRKYSRDKEVHHVLMSIRPRLLGLPPDQTLTHAVRIGTETRLITPI